MIKTYGHQWKVTEVKEVARLYMDGYGYAAISEKTGIPKKSVENRIRSMNLNKKISRHIAPHLRTNRRFIYEKALS